MLRAGKWAGSLLFVSALVAGCDPALDCKDSVVAVYAMPYLGRERGLSAALQVGGQSFSLPCPGSTDDPGHRWHVTCDSEGGIVITGQGVNLDALTELVLRLTAADGRVFADDVTVPLGPIYRPDVDGAPNYCQRDGKVTATIEPPPPPGTVFVLSPGVVSFGPVPVGGTSQTTRVTIINGGDVASGTPLLSVQGEFLLEATTCGLALAIGQVCMVDLAFQPRSPGPKTGTFSIQAIPGGAKTITLAGEGT
jgi:hypothetical protein